MSGIFVTVTGKAFNLVPFSCMKELIGVILKKHGKPSLAHGHSNKHENEEWREFISIQNMWQCVLSS
jgi:hypothetical protein